MDMDMQMTDRVPDWLTPVAWIYIALSLLAAAHIAFDFYARRHRHQSVANELVWLTSALYLGPFALPLYHRYGRTRTSEHWGTSGQPTAVAGLPGGGASAIAHLIGVPLVIASGLTIAGLDLWVMIIAIGVLAMALLFVYERTARREGTRRAVPVGAAAAAAVLTVLAFDIGMGGWMLLLHFNDFMPPATEGTFWFLMQVGIILGLLTGYPAVRWLTRRQRSFLPA
jgi:ABC-type Co2+ transport system permease subunit